MFKYYHIQYMIIYALSDGPLWMKIFQEYFRVHTPIGHSHQGGTFRSEGWYISYFIGSMVIFRVVLRIFLPVKNSTKWKYRQDIPSRDPPCWVSNFSPPLSLSCCFWCFFWGGLKGESLGGIQVAIKLHVSTRALHQQSHRALGRRHGEMTRGKE